MINAETTGNEEVILYNTDDSIKKVTETDGVHIFNLVDPTHPFLYTKLPEFNFENPPINPNEFASSLVETCKKYNGLGLSANQCGFMHRVFVMGAGDSYISCFNPKVISTEDEAHLDEGCLSFPFLQLKITRPKRIVVEYQDWTGEKHTSTFEGLTARVFLHELDHMDGMLYTMRVKPLALKSGLKKLEKIRRKYFNPNILKQINGNKKTNP